MLFSFATSVPFVNRKLFILLCVVLLNFVDKYIKKRLCILLKSRKLKEIFHHKNFLIMHNLKTNFDKIYDITKSFFDGSINADYNFYNYPWKPKMSDCEIITLSILDESMIPIWLTQYPYLFVRSQEKNHVESVKKILKLLPIKSIQQWANPGTLGINYTWLLLSEVFIPAWI